MSSVATDLDHINVPLINNPNDSKNPPVVRNTPQNIPTQSRFSTITLSHIIKMISFLALSFFGIVGSIIACSTSYNIRPFIAQPPVGPVDGEWSDWNLWSPCSISCSSKNEPFGRMTRTRYCNSPPPQESGKNCIGNSEENTECFKIPCPIPVDGNWAEWTPWSTCSSSCQSISYIPTQTRSSTCTNPAPKDGGKDCEGRNVKERFCTWLIQCPVDGQWGEWYVAGACESLNRKSCALGKKLYQRQCNKPSPSASGKNCEGIKEKNEDCWFEIGCPIDLQPPLNLQVFGNGSGIFEIHFASVPYGIVAVKYRIFLTIEDKDKNQIETIHLNVSAIPPLEISGRQYKTDVDMRKFLENSNFSTLVVRMSSFDYWDKESSLSAPVPSKARAVDGQWGNWDHWSECSTECSNKRGIRTRKRKCDNPSPAEGGKLCFGKWEEQVSCIGMEREC